LQDRQKTEWSCCDLFRRAGLQRGTGIAGNVGGGELEAGHEIIVADNASTSATSKIAKISANSSISIRSTFLSRADRQN
jgi:hypothetical protein